ncbi:MAG: cadherin repeat domain-containing protein [Planctomycetota bacterium]
MPSWKTGLASLVLGCAVFAWWYISEMANQRRDIISTVREEHCFVLGELELVQFGDKTAHNRQGPLLELMSSVGCPYSVLFAGCQPADEALREIRMMRRTKRLAIQNSPFDDRQMQLLMGSDHLQSITLSHNLVSDDSISMLIGLKGLKQLRVGHTRVTTQGIDKFKRIRPDVDLSFHAEKKQPGLLMPLPTAPTFYPSSYLFYISDATENGDAIGRIAATDRDSLQIKYSFSSNLTPYITVDTTGLVKITDAAGLRMNMQFASQFSFAGTAIATNSALLAGNASVTIYLRNDPLAMDSEIREYINVWYGLTNDNASYIGEIAKLVISVHIDEIVAGWEEWRVNYNDRTNLTWGISGFIPVPKYASKKDTAAVLSQIIASRFYSEPGLANIGTMKSRVEVDCLAVLLSSRNQILKCKWELLEAWGDARSVIDANTAEGSAKRARQYAAYLVKLQKKLIVPPPLTLTLDELWDLIK